jgi:hypothetical protein
MKIQARQSMQVGVAVLLAGLVAFWSASFLWSDTAPVPPSSASKVGTSATAPTVEIAPVESSHSPVMAPATSSAAVATLKTQIATTKHEFQSSTDWRAFAIAASQQPGRGGHFYAMQAANLCGRDIVWAHNKSQERTVQEIQATGTVSSQRLELADRLRARCSAFTKDEAYALYKQTKELSKDRGDPLVAARARVRTAIEGTDRSAVVQAMSELIALGDFSAATNEMLLLRALRFDPINKQHRNGWFAGEEINSEQQGDLQLALQLAVCKRGEQCESNELLPLSCMSPGGCEVSPIKHFRDFYVGHEGVSEDYFNRTVALSERIRAAFDAGDAEAFVPPARQQAR